MPAVLFNETAILKKYVEFFLQTADRENRSRFAHVKKERHDIFAKNSINSLKTECYASEFKKTVTRPV